MTQIRSDAPWHRQSYDRFLEEALPQLLAERLPLAGYQTIRTGEQSVKVTVAVAQGEHAAQITFDDLPAPSEAGVFLYDNRPVVVTPIADNEHLDKARVRCVGDQLIDYVADHLGRAPDAIEWDTALLASWVPLDHWLKDYLRPAASAPGVRPRAMRLDETNWLSRLGHLRRIFIESLDDVIAPGQHGLACPLESPEGPNLGHVMSISVGAEIRDGRLLRIDEEPSAMLGLTASMMPLVEYDDNNRALMGANMMRQWLAPVDREPALVQSGNEPDDEAFWCGRNLLTAFVSWGGDTFEDAIVISQSAAGKLACVDTLAVGDKLSNRHGTKGVVGRTVPDEEMPHLQDGTPIELCFSFIACHTRMNPGQVREAVLGRIAKSTGETIVAPPFRGPDDETMRQMLRAAKLDVSGMETLTAGADGTAMARPSAVGYVYWGHPNHRAVDKLHVFVGQRVGEDTHQAIGEMEFLTLRDAGAKDLINDLYSVQNVDGADVDAILDAVGKSAEPSRPASTPQFNELAARLSAIGIGVSHDSSGLAFSASDAAGGGIELAEPVPHPWRTAQKLAFVAPAPGTTDTLAAVRSANDRLARLIADGSPSPLISGARQHLQATVRDHAAVTLQPTHLKPHARVLFSGRGVMAPGTELTHDQIGLPDQMAWGLFGPFIESAVGADAVANRTSQASAALDRAMVDRWVIMARAPAILPTSVLAFRPIRIEDLAIRVPPQVLRLINGDFDGDQVAVFLPLTTAAQVEAEQRLSVAAHLQRDRDFVLPLLVPKHEPLWALADVSRRAGGVAQLAGTIGTDLSAPGGVITFASLHADLADLMDSGGSSAVLEAIERIYSFGFAHARASGASFSPFIADAAEPLPSPEGNDLGIWEQYHLECEQRVITMTDYDDPCIGPQLLAVRSGARGNAWQLRALASVFGLVVDAGRNFTPAPTCVARGRSPDEFWHCAAGARHGLADLLEQQQVRSVHTLSEGPKPDGFAPLARAMRSSLPGVVFAHAAATGEIDPLVEIDSQLFVGV